MSYDTKKLLETIKMAIRNHRAIETPVGLRWHNTPEVDFEYIYSNFDSLSEADLKRLLKDTIYEEAVNAL